MSGAGKYLLLTLSTVVLISLLAEPVPVKIPEVVPAPVPVVVCLKAVLPKITLVPEGEELRLNPEAMLRRPTIVPHPVSVRPLVDFHTLGVQCSIGW